MRSTSLAVAAAAGGIAIALSSAPAGYAATPHPASAPARGHLRHGLGAKVDPHRTLKLPSASTIASELRAMEPHAVHGHASTTATTAKPALSAVDLTSYAITPGDQGDVNSCVSWAIDHTAFGILENEQGISGGPQAPMYTYSQLVRGSNVGTRPSDTLAIAKRQGVDSESDYWQGDYNYWTQPTQAEKANAATWRLSGSTALHTGSGIRTDVQNALAYGEPVIVSIPYYDSFGSLSSSRADDYSYYPSQAELNSWQSNGSPSHEVTIVGYTSQGVTIENSWGTNWGDAGFATLPWSFLTNLAMDANALGGLVQ